MRTLAPLVLTPSFRPNFVLFLTFTLLLLFLIAVCHHSPLTNAHPGTNLTFSLLLPRFPTHPSFHASVFIADLSHTWTSIILPFSSTSLLVVVVVRGWWW